MISYLYEVSFSFDPSSLFTLSKLSSNLTFFFLQLQLSIATKAQFNFLEPFASWFESYVRTRRERREEKKIRTKWTKFGRVTSGCRCVSIGSHVTQVASDFPNKLPPRESRVPETFIDTLLCIHGHTPGIMGLPGPPTPFPPLCSAGCGPHFMLVTPLFPESVYYHRPVSSFMQNNLISRASKSRQYNAALYNVFCSLLLVPRRQLSPSPFPSVFEIDAREEIIIIYNTLLRHAVVYNIYFYHTLSINQKFL